MDATRLDFRPFRAWRYNPDRAKLNEVIAPPYDVISSAGRETLYRKSPFNVVRLILGKEPNFYEAAATHWQKWAQEGILVQDKTPAIYLYEQSFKHPWDSQSLSRLAIVGILKLDESGAVLRHEATFDAPKRDRLQLLEKTKTNLSPIFGLYQNSQKMKSLFSAVQKKKPLFQAQDEEGVLNRVWAVQDMKDQESIHEALTHQKIMIADGHHRYETALEYQKQMHKQSQNTSKEQPFDFVMMALVSEDDKGLLILPTHRIVRSLARGEKKFLESLHQHFESMPYPDKEIFQILNSQPKEQKVFGVILKSGSFLIRLKPASEMADPIEAKVLERFIFDSQVEYTHSSEEALGAVRKQNAQAAFLMRSPEVDTIRKLAYAGERMPQKTTYFYPKLASGLLFYHHGI